MNSAQLLNWIKIIGPLIISWPIFGMITIIIFRKYFSAIIHQFSNPDNINKTGTMRVKVGLIEMERNITQLTEKVTEQKVEQERQKSEIETLRFLISNFVTDAELIHLEKLSKDEPFLYEMTPYFELELRRLRSLGLIENFPNKGIRSMTQKGNLKDYFFITNRGREYLELRM